MDDALAAYTAAGYRTVPGWAEPLDLALLVAIDDVQRDHGVSGDLLEIGSYLGRLAVLLGYFRRGGDELVICDLFDNDAPDGANAWENKVAYGGLTELAFRANFERFHRSPPRVVVGASDALGSHVEADSFRLVHIDGSHLFDNVMKDVALSRELVREGGAFVVFDDLVSRHTPGVAAAVWQAVGSMGLVPLACSSKLYATWDRTPVHDAWLELIARSFSVSEQRINGERILIVYPSDVRSLVQRLVELSPAGALAAMRKRWPPARRHGARR